MDNLAYTIQTLKSGNQEAFEKLYRFYYKGLCAFSAQFVSFAEAEEIVQDTMLWLWENKDKINPELSLKSLLFTTVKNKSLNLLTHDDIKRRVHQEIIDAFEEDLRTLTPSSTEKLWLPTTRRCRKFRLSSGRYLK